MKKDEKVAVLLFGLFVAVITSLPYVLGWLSSGPELFFTGLLIGVEDGNSYLAKMLTGAEGAWLFKTPYTAFPQRGFLAFLPYLLLGKLSGTQGDYGLRIILFHLFRLSGITVCTFSVYRFIAIFIEGKKYRLLVLTLVTFGGGLGFIYLLGLKDLWSYLPLEFYSPETFGFLSYLSIPHLLWARALLFLGLTQFIESKSEPIVKAGIKIGLYWNLLGLFQPLTMLIGWAIISTYTIVEIILGKLKKINEKKDWLLKPLNKLLIIIGVSSPLVIYTFIAFQIDPFLRNWQSQNIILSPPAIEYLLAYGLLIPFAFVEIFKSIRKGWDENLLLIIWVFLLPFFVYAPYLLQRRLAEGGYVALSILAVKGLLNNQGRLGKITLVWFTINFFTTITIIIGALNLVSLRSFPLYLREEEIQLFQAVRQMVPKQSIVLADWELSTLLPAHAPIRVIMGHGPESVRGNQIREKIEILYLHDEPYDLFNFFREENVEYWILDKSKIPEFMKSNSELKFINEIYENENYTIYKVVK